MVLYSDTFISFFLVKISKQGVSFYSLCKSGVNIDSMPGKTAWLRVCIFRVKVESIFVRGIYKDFSSLLYLAIFLHYLSFIDKVMGKSIRGIELDN